MTVNMAEGQEPAVEAQHVPTPSGPPVQSMSPAVVPGAVATSTAQDQPGNAVAQVLFAGNPAATEGAAESAPPSETVEAEPTPADRGRRASPAKGEPRPTGNRPARGSKGMRFQFSVRVTEKLDPDALMLEFVQQYYGVDLAKADELRQQFRWQWKGKPPTVTEAHLRKGYILLPVTDYTLGPTSAAEHRDLGAYARRLAQANQDELNAETNRLFWTKTNYKVGQPLGNTAGDRAMARYWVAIRDELIRQRQGIDALSPSLRAFLFVPEAPQTLTPRDYASVLRIADKLESLGEADLQEYRDMVNKEADWAGFEASVDRYLRERRRRQIQAESREQAKASLVGLKELYLKLKEYRSAEKTVVVAPSSPHAMEAAVRAQQYAMDTAARLKAELSANLPRYDFVDIAAFEQAIQNYRAAFERETVDIAHDLLQRYEHTLHREERRYNDPHTVAALAGALSRSQARQRYRSASGAKGLAETIHPGPDMPHYLPGELTRKMQYQEEAKEQRRLGEAEVARAATGHPLVAQKDFDRERLAMADPGEVRGVMMGYIEARRKDLATTRGHLATKPQVIYKLDVLLERSYEAQGIEKGSIFDLIVQDRRNEIHISETIRNIVLAVISLAIGALTFGTGTVAMLAAGVVFGISAYQALQEFHEYEVMRAAHRSGFLSDDPTIAWAIIALVGAGFDAAAVLKAISPAVRGFLTTFWETGNVSRLEKQLEGLRKLERLDDAMRASLIKAARAHGEYRKAVGALRTSAWSLNMVVGGSEAMRQLVVVAYQLTKRGVIGFERFLLELKLQRIIPDVTGLSPEELSALRRAWRQGVAKSKTGLVNYGTLSKEVRALYTAEQVDEIAAHGMLLGLQDKEIKDILELASLPGVRPSKVAFTPAELQELMKSWTIRKQLLEETGKQVPLGARALEETMVTARHLEKVRQYHHLLVRQLRRWFKRQGVDIDRYTIKLSADEHRWIHNEYHWNDIWREFMRNNQKATPVQIKAQMKAMLKEFGLEGLPIVPYPK
jgi:hypothetical protein